jgi:anti-sigma factor ChrR (cupin superfamily)
MADKRDEAALEPMVAGLLGSALDAPKLAAPLRERLRERVLERAAGIHVVRADGGAWVPVMAGISIKRLHQDLEGGSETNLWRLSAGAIIPEHDHRSDEECLVVEGSIVQGGIEYRAGDYLLAPAGSHHLPLQSPHGALLLIRSQSLKCYFSTP